MVDLEKNCRVAVVQCAPIMFDKDATLAKCIDLIKQAGAGGAQLIVLPELIIPCYPYGMTFGFTVGSRQDEGRADWKRYYDGSIVVPGAETDALGQAAREVNAYVSVGISERDAVSGTLYNSNIIFAPDGSIAALHRKLKPTGAERFVWGDADKAYFPVVASPWGPLGNLICWESYMPLARVALYQKGVTILISCNTMIILSGRLLFSILRSKDAAITLTAISSSLKICILLICMHRMKSLSCLSLSVAAAAV